MRSRFVLILVLSTAAIAEARSAAPLPGPYCSGDYADDLASLSAAARAFDQRQAPYTYCVRTSATYECPSYRADGTLRKTRRKVVAHGTAFGLRHQGGETLLVTNEHVAEWPAVTDEDHEVEDVPHGCKRVATAIRIVDDEADAYERDDVSVSRLVSDSELDVSVLRARGALPVVPWKIGRSADLRERNAVDIRGFPLAALRANNVGKVISTRRQDDENGWDHEDFVVDALLSPGSSGSPVFAVSCRTGEFELVGVYHARYPTTGALNHVVGIDQVRDLLTTLKRAPRAPADAPPPEVAARAKLREAARGALEPFFPLGPLTAAVRARDDGALVFEVMSRDFPLQAHPLLVLEDLPASDGRSFGRIGRVWAGNRQGLREVTDALSDGDAREQVSKLVEALRSDAAVAFAYRTAARAGMGSREQFQEIRRLEKAVRRAITSHQELGQSATDLAEQLCPRFADAPLTLADVLGPASPPEPRRNALVWKPTIAELPSPGWSTPASAPR